LILLAVGNFFSVLTNVFIQGLTGNESIDLNKKATFRQYMKSKLFYPHTLRLIQSFSSILILPIGLIILTHNNYDVITLVEFWAITSLVTQIPLTFVLYLSARNTLQFSLNRITISKYLIVSIITFSIIFILSEQFLIYNDDLYSFVLEAFIFAILGISLYLIFTYILDSNTRILLKSIINEMINKIDGK